MSEHHKKDAPRSLSVAVISVSSTRSIEDDKSGLYIKSSAIEKNHRVTHHLVVDDEVEEIKNAVTAIADDKETDAILITGGTGIAERDVTIEAVKPLFDKELTSYGTIFTMLSYDEIGSSAVMSRSTAGIINETAVFCMPGSQKACKLACEKIIFKELPHIKKHLLD